MKLLMIRSAIFAMALGAGLLDYSKSQAGLLPVSNTVMAAGSDFRYSYGVVLSSETMLRTGDYFTIYDFQGMILGSNTQPANFTFSSAMIGPTPAGTNPTDSPTVANVTWTYTGPNTVVGEIGLGNFMVQSQYGSNQSGVFAAVTQRTVGGQNDSNITEATVPVPSVPVPEPVSLAIVGMSLPLIGLVWRQRRRS
jgi:hypothetical protein